MCSLEIFTESPAFHRCKGVKGFVAQYASDQVLVFISKMLFWFRTGCLALSYVTHAVHRIPASALCLQERRCNGLKMHGRNSRREAVHFTPVRYLVTWILKAWLRFSAGTGPCFPFWKPERGIPDTRCVQRQITIPLTCRASLCFRIPEGESCQGAWLVSISVAFSLPWSCLKAVSGSSASDWFEILCITVVCLVFPKTLGILAVGMFKGWQEGGSQNWQVGKGFFLYPQEAYVLYSTVEYFTNPRGHRVR